MHDAAAGGDVPPAYSELVARIHRTILDRGERVEPGDRAMLCRLVQENAPLCTATEVDELAELVSQRLFGLGAIEALLADETVDEIMINGPGRVWVERCGALHKTGVAVDAATLRMIIERIVAPLGLRVDRTVPFVDARLPDGSRVHVAVPPLAIDGPYVTIRRFGESAYSLDDFGARPVVELLTQAVRRRANLIVSGGTGSGKTSLLNGLAAHIPDGDRVVTVEDAAELRLPGNHVIRLEARPPNAEGAGEVTVRTLVRNSLRMRPDRIIVGEVRGAEALDMVQAMNTGHEGSMSTCHANSALDGLRRLETMVLMSDVDLPLEVVREHLHSAIDVLVHVERASGGTRRVTDVLARSDSGFVPLIDNEALTEAGRSWIAGTPR